MLIPKRLYLNCVLVASMSLCVCRAADDAPQPPCGVMPSPPYAEPGAQPNVKIWNARKEPLRIAARCEGIPAGDFKTAVALSGSFRYDDTADKILERFAAVSQMKGIRYWSVTDQAWRVLVTESTAVEPPPQAARRTDFNTAELKTQKDVFFAQRDSRSTGEVLYRMRVTELNSDRVVVESENASAIKTFIFTLFKPGELHTIHFLTRRTGGIWTYYALTVVGSAQSDSHMASLVNRAASLYRYVAGQPTDQEPPLAPR
jgi:hypothetical protein